MNHIVAVRQYTSAAEMMASYAAVKRKFRTVRPVQKPVLALPAIIAKQIGLTIAPCVELPIVHYVKDTDDKTQFGYAGDKTQISHIVRVVAAYYGCFALDIISERRTRRVIEPRHVGMYLSKIMTVRSLPEIGRRFGNRDHTTVLHGYRKIAARVEIDDEFRAKVEQIRKQVMAS